MLIEMKWIHLSVVKIQFTHFLFLRRQWYDNTHFFSYSRGLSHIVKKIKRSKSPFDIYRWHLPIVWLSDTLNSIHSQNIYTHTRTHNTSIEKIIAQKMTATDLIHVKFITIQINHKIKRRIIFRMTQNNCNIRFINERTCKNKNIRIMR